MGILFASAGTFAYNDVHFLRCAAADEFERERLADRFAVELRVDIFETRDGMAGERDENVSNDDAGFVRGAFGLNFQDDGGGFFAALQGLSESFGQTDGLQADAEITLRNVTLLQERINDAVDRGCGDGDRAEAGETRRGDADDAALRVDYGATDGCGLQADVQADVGREGGAGPSAALGDYQADCTERGYGAAGAGAADY